MTPPLVHIAPLEQPGTPQQLKEPYYLLLLFDGDARFSVDFTPYDCSGKGLVFLSPYQYLEWQSSQAPEVQVLRFHGDFYCIEYHREEVACNGILFNNIYEKPMIEVPGPVYQEIRAIFQKIKAHTEALAPADISIIRSYLQLILALSSKEKRSAMAQHRQGQRRHNAVATFQSLLEKHFIRNRSVAFYAAHYGLSVSAFNKQVKRQFGKTPSQLIGQRLVLEAKRLLHLTHKSVKEIAPELGFEDRFYFSRFFKKEVGVAPKTFREKVGISIAAK